MSREVRVSLFLMGGMRLELDGSERSKAAPDLRSRRSEKEAEEIPPPMYGAGERDESVLVEEALRLASSCSLTCFQRFMLIDDGLDEASCQDVWVGRCVK